MADPHIPGDPLFGWLRSRVGQIERRLQKLEMPSGTQLAQVTATVSEGLTAASIARITQIANTAAAALVPVGVRVSIAHVEASGYSYEVIRVSGGGPNVLTKAWPDAAASNGWVARTSLQTLSQTGSAHGWTALVNADAWVGSDGSAPETAVTVRPVGLQIHNGQPIQEFGVAPGMLVGSDLEALVMLADGTLTAARKSDGSTVAQRVAAGAVESFGYGPIVVENSALRDIESSGTFTGFTGTISGRTILGQTAGGDYIIIVVDGKDGVSGIKGNTCGQLALQYGCRIAVLMDGGGSSQALWRGNLIHPSSDPGVRAVHSALVIGASETNAFDTGQITVATNEKVTGTSMAGAPALYLRQRDDRVTLTANLTCALPNDSWVQITDTAIADRYRAAGDIEARGLLLGQQGAPVGISTATDTHLFNLRVKPSGLTSNIATGAINWRAQYA